MSYTGIGKYGLLERLHIWPCTKGSPPDVGVDQWPPGAGATVD